MSRQWGMVLGPLLILLGLLWSGWLKNPLAMASYARQTRRHALGAFLLGMPFAVGGLPGVLTGAVVAVSIGWLENLQSVGRWRRAFEMQGGITLMAVGLYLLNDYYFWI